MGKVATRSALRMGVEDLPGVPAKGEIVGGFWDPLKLSVGKDDATIEWYRSAELKHGRVSMVAALGLFVQELNTGIIPNPAFTEGNGLAAVKKVYTENPAALVQIGLAIAAVEVLTASFKNNAPGDFNWDPAQITPKTEEKLFEMKTKELKNGRLAMLGVAGMLYQSALTGQATLEQINSGHISPFADGQGFF